MEKFIKKSAHWFSATLMALSISSCNNNSDTSEKYLDEIRKARIIPIVVTDADNLAGYMDANGELAIPARFRQAGYFHDNLALVIDTTGLAGYIDHYGKYVIQPKYKSATDFTDGLAWVAEPDSALKVIDTKGETKFHFDKAYTADAFFNKIALYKTVSGNLGLVNTDGNEIELPDSIMETTACVDNKLLLKSVNNRQCIGQIKNGKFEVIDIPGDPDIEGANLKKNLVIFYVDGKRGLIDFSGKIIVNPRYSKLAFDGDDMIIFESDKEKYGWLDLNGNEVIPAKYKAVQFLFNGGKYAVVTTSGSKFQSINKKGETVIKPKYKKLYKPIYTDDIFAMADDELCGLLDTDGNVLCEPQFKDIHFGSDNIIMATSGDNRWGVINKFGQYQSPTNYKPISQNALSAQSQKTDIDNIVAIAMDMRGKARFNISWPSLANEFNLSKFDMNMGVSNVVLRHTSIPGADITFMVSLDNNALTSARSISKARINSDARPYAYLIQINLNSPSTRDNTFTALEKASGLTGEISDASLVADFTPDSITLFITAEEQFLNTIK